MFFGSQLCLSVLVVVRFEQHRHSLPANTQPEDIYFIWPLGIELGRLAGRPLGRNCNECECSREKRASSVLGWSHQQGGDLEEHVEKGHVCIITILVSSEGCTCLRLSGECRHTMLPCLDHERSSDKAARRRGSAAKRTRVPGRLDRCARHHSAEAAAEAAAHRRRGSR